MKARIGLLSNGLLGDTLAHDKAMSNFVNTQEILSVGQYEIDPDSIVVHISSEDWTILDWIQFVEKYKEYFNKCQSEKETP